MVSFVRDIGNSPLESAGWFLGGAGLAGIGLWIYDKYFGGRESLENWKIELQKDLGMDLLKINKTLCFGIQTRKCSFHEQGILFCKDLDCLVGPLGHLVDTINMAQKTVDIAIFSFTSRIIGDAILGARERGALVRVVADAESAYSSGSVLPLLRKSGIQVRERISPYHMHHKFIVLDGEILINGSMNFSDTGTVGNWENLVITSDPGMVLPFVKEFQVLWADFEQGHELIFHKIPDHARTVRNHRIF